MSPDWGPDPKTDLPDLILTEPRPWDKDTLVATSHRLEDVLDVPVQAVRADRVLGPIHLVMAIHHAVRSFETGRARARAPAMETLLYLAADRQIHRAIEKMGLPFDAGATAAVFLPIELGRRVDPANVADVLRDVSGNVLGPSMSWSFRERSMAYWADVLDIRVDDPTGHATGQAASSGLAPVDRAMLAAQAALAVDKS